MSGTGDWFEDEAFWTAYAPLMFDDKHWAEVPAVVDAIEKLVGLKPGAAILDSCCGPGRHSLELAARGYAVTGLDITQAFLDAARESADAFGVQPEFVHGDLRSFARPGSFDLALNLFTSFGYFAERSQDIAALRNLRLSLRSGGNLIIETVGKETAARDFIENEWFERGGWTVLTEFSVVGAWEALRNRWLLIPGDDTPGDDTPGEDTPGEDTPGIPSAGGKRVDRSFDLRLYSGVELREALMEAGFSSVRIYGSLEGSAYDQNAKSLVAVALA